MGSDEKTQEIQVGALDEILSEIEFDEYLVDLEPLTESYEIEMILDPSHLMDDEQLEDDLAEGDHFESDHFESDHFGNDQYERHPREPWPQSLESDSEMFVVEADSEPISFETDSSGEIVPGVGIYQVTYRRPVKPAIANAALRHLRRSYRLLKRLERNQLLLEDEKQTLREVEDFLIRNRQI